MLTFILHDPNLSDGPKSQITVEIILILFKKFKLIIDNKKSSYPILYVKTVILCIDLFSSDINRMSKKTALLTFQLIMPTFDIKINEILFNPEAFPRGENLAVKLFLRPYWS